MSLKVLEVCLSPNLGGLELSVVNCFNYFKDKESSFLVISPKSKLDSYVKTDDKYLLKRNKFFPFFPALKLAKYIDKNDIDTIHFHWTKDMPMVILAKLFSERKPKIIQSRHMLMTRFKDDFYHKWLYKHIDIIHAVTNQVKEQLIKYIPEDIRPKVEMVYLGIEKPIIDPVKVNTLKETYKLKNTFIVGIIGRIQKNKGQYLLLEAISKLKHLNIKGLIVGHTMDEDYENKLKKKAKFLNIEDKIIFTGFTKNVNEHMKLCDVTVLATQKETFGLVVIESMVNKVPVIATNNGGPLEIINNGIDGLLFDGTSDNLASQIQIFFDNEEYRNDVALAGYNKVIDKFNAKKQNDALYKAILHS